MNEEDVINEKDSKFKKFKKLFMENGCIRLSVYSAIMFIVFIIPMPALLAYLAMFLMFKIEYYALLASYDNDDLESKYSGFPSQKVGELDQKVADFIKKPFRKLIKLLKKENKDSIDEEIKIVDNLQTIEGLNNQLKELTDKLDGSIVRDSKVIAKEKAEYEGLLELLDKYQAMPKKDQTVNYTPVPTIEVDSTSDKGYSYTKK